MNHLIRSCLIAVVTLALGQSAALAADGTVVRISERDCRQLTAHVPDRGATYEPGRDVRGKAVVPADLGGAPRLAVPETIVIPIEVDLQDRFGFPDNAESFEADAQIGVVEVAPDGSANFNGQPLQDEAQAELTRRCQEILYGRPLDLFDR